MPKDMVNAYGIEDVEKGKSQEITRHVVFRSSNNRQKHAKVTSIPELKTG